MDDNKCINCEIELTGAYCSSCGQKGQIERITTKSLFSNYIGRIFGFDTKFLRTIKDLTISPGIVGRTFIEGNRVRYIDPVGYFFIISTLMILTFVLLNVNIQDFLYSSSNQISQIGEQSKPTIKQLAMQQKVMQLASDNMRILGFLVIPFIALTGKMLYKKSGLNFLEHSTHAFYVQGHTTILTILAIILFKITGINTNLYIIVVFIPYFMWAALSFYQKKGFWQWIKGLIFYLVSNLLFFLAVTITIAGVGYLYVKFINPAFLD